MGDIQINTLSDDHAIQFLRELKSRIHYNSMRKVIALLRTIFSGIKTGLSTQQYAVVEAKSPRILQLIFLNKYRCSQDHETQEIKHLDEFVDRLCDSTNKNNRKIIFKSEIDALRVVSIVLISIEGLYRSVGVQLLNYTLLRELDEIAYEEEVQY